MCSARNAEQASALGAHHVIDYAETDFTTADTRHDVVIDLVGNRSIKDVRRVVAPSGAVVLSGGGIPGEGRFIGAVALLVRAQLAGGGNGPSVLTPQAVPTRATLEDLADLVATGGLRVQIERTFDLDDAAAALRHMETEHARAKVVVACGR